MQDRRKLVRRRTLRGGRLAYDDGAQTAECLIRDLSETGARVRVADIRRFPSELVLSFDGRPGSRSCFVKWRRGDALGLVFTDAGKALPAV